MFYSYRDYLNEPGAMTVEEMQALHGRILAEVRGDEDAEELYGELLEASARYIDYRANWPLYSREKKIDQDASRTSAHTSVITHTNMLSRYLNGQGKDGSWIDVLGNPEADRKRYGDFGCYIAFAASLNAR